MTTKRNWSWTGKFPAYELCLLWKCPCSPYFPHSFWCIISSLHQPHLSCNNANFTPICLLPLCFHFYYYPHTAAFDSHPIASPISTFSLSSPLLARVAPAMQQYHLPAQHAHSLVSTHTRPQTLLNTRSVWQGHRPAQDTPISTLPPLDHPSPTHCVTQGTATYTALLSHTLHLSPNRGSRGASAITETGVLQAPFTVREQIPAAIVQFPIVDGQEDHHMGVCSTLTTNELK